MHRTPSEAEVEWLKTAELPLPPEFYTTQVSDTGTIELHPMFGTSLRPTDAFVEAVARIDRGTSGPPMLRKVVHACTSNLVMHGPTHNTMGTAGVQRASMITGSAGNILASNPSPLQRVLSSDQSAGKPAHSRLTIKRKRGQGDNLSPRQQVMRFSNLANRPPHQVRSELHTVAGGSREEISFWRYLQTIS